MMGFPVYVLLGSHTRHQTGEADRIARGSARSVRDVPASDSCLRHYCRTATTALRTESLCSTITSSQHSLNVVPFRTIWGYAFTHNDQVSDWGLVATMNLLANVLLFMPLGFLMPLVRRGATTLRHALVIGAATSVCDRGCAVLHRAQRRHRRPYC